MFFRDEYSMQEWVEKFPNLKVINGKCDGCGKKLKTTRPFVSRGYAGLMAPACCKKQKSTCMTMVTTSYEEFLKWNKLIYGEK